MNNLQHHTIFYSAGKRSCYLVRSFCKTSRKVGRDDWSLKLISNATQETWSTFPFLLLLESCKWKITFVKISSLYTGILFHFHVCGENFLNMFRAPSHANGHGSSAPQVLDRPRMVLEIHKKNHKSFTIKLPGRSW